MPKGRLSFTVPRPAGEVFSYISDLERSSEWVPDLVSVTKETDGETGVGTGYREIVKMGEREMEGRLEVTRYEPPNVFAHNGEGGPVRFSATFTLNPVGGGTEVVHDYTVSFRGLFWIFSPFVGRWVRKNSEAAMEKLKSVLSSGAEG